MTSWRSFAGVCAAAAVLVAVWATRRDVDPAEHDAYARDVRRLEALDAELSEQLVLSRSGLVLHYDGLARTVAELRATFGVLRAPPAFVRGDQRAELLARVAAAEELLDHEDGLLERFKSENAVLRNSIRFFPVAAASALAGSDGDASREILQRLLEDVVLLTSAADANAAAAMARDVDELAARRPAPATDAAIAALHARVIVDRRPRVDALTSELLTLDASGRAYAIDATYERIHEAGVAAASTRRTVLFVLGLATMAFAAAEVVTRTRRDAARLRATSEALKSALEAQKELGVLKNRFVSMASHEFRTPLAAILSSAELLEAYGDRWPPEKRALHFARIDAGVKAMANLLDRILLVGRSEAGMLAFRPTDVDLASICADLVESARREASEGRTIVHRYAGPSEPVRMDEKLLGHILSNLISNALKYSPPGGEVRFEVASDGEDVVFVVRDRGIGIPAEDRARLFETFHRASNVGRVPGTGLGLAIVKASTELHRGRIDVDSVVGEGTTFTVTLPTTGTATAGEATADERTKVEAKETEAEG